MLAHTRGTRCSLTPHLIPQVVDLKLTKMRTAVRLLWGLVQEMQMRASEQQQSINAGNELLESLDSLLDTGKQ